MKKITGLLGALDKMLHNVHLIFKDYAEHLLADRLRDGISDNIDRLKELSIAFDGNLGIASAVESAKDILQYVEAAYPEEQSGNPNLDLWKAIRELYIFIIAECSEQISLSDSEGIINALGDISEGLMRDKYLVDGVLKGYGHSFKK